VRMRITALALAMGAGSIFVLDLVLDGCSVGKVSLLLASPGSMQLISNKLIHWYRYERSPHDNQNSY
jgi:hypothetical protein